MPKVITSEVDALARRLALSALVSEVWTHFGSTMDWERLVPLVIEKTVATADAEAGSLWLCDKTGGTVTCAMAIGPRAANIQGSSVRIPEGIVGSVVESGETRFIPDAAADPEFAEAFDRESGFKTGSMIVAPIKSPGRVLGAIEVLNKKGGALFTQDDLDVLLMVCGAAGQALENARLHGELGAAYERVAEANRSLVALDRAKSEFTAVASHELRTPISAISGYVELLMRDPSRIPPEILKPLKGIERATARLTTLVDHVSAAMTVHVEGIVLDRRPTDPLEVARGVVDDLAGASRARNLSLSMHGADLPPARIDPEKMKVALANLVRNAIRFTPDGGAIDLAVKRDGRFALVYEVRDSGIGIPPAEATRIFERFVTGADPLTHHSGTLEFGSRGLGLGLYLARAIARAHGGEIALETAVGRGSTFRISLPGALEP
ncbi:MAG: GAF domain-containing sensor histidine kinase [Acidobacteriota bacterium]